MKLLRLTTTNELAVFDNNLHDELILKPNSKIALQNLTIDASGEVITIDNQNNLITMSITPSIIDTLELPFGTYTQSNVTLLTDALQKQLNFNMAWFFDNSRRYLGAEWKVSTVKNKINIEMKYASILSTEDLKLTDNIEFVSNQLRFKETTPEGVSGNLYYLYDNTFCSRGNGYIRTKIYKLSLNSLNANNNGYIVGLMKTDPATYKGEIIPMADIDYGLWVGRNSGTYMTIKNGNLTNTFTAPNNYGVGDADNDSQEISINGGNIEINIYTKDSNNFKEAITFLQEEYDNLTEYYPVVILRGGYDYARVSNIRYTPSAFNTPQIKKDDEAETLTAPPQQSTTPQICFLNFQSIEVANFFGFTNSNNPQIPNSYIVSEPHYIADNNFDPVDKADAYIVELLNMKIESYDGYLNQRKNILAVIPENNNSDNGLIQYTPPYLSMIDLNNPKELALRNIRCRVVKSDYTPIDMKGLGTITLIFD